VLQIEGIRKEFSEGAVPVTALEAVDLAIERGEFVTLVGPSGCGKSSLLTLISGLAAPSAGRWRRSPHDREAVHHAGRPERLRQVELPRR
jgi:ABC-type Fe3+/spermidine/putrescine transport system ATPase subunit